MTVVGCNCGTSEGNNIIPRRMIHEGRMEAKHQRVSNTRNRKRTSMVGVLDTCIVIYEIRFTCWSDGRRVNA